MRKSNGSLIFFAIFVCFVSAIPSVLSIGISPESIMIEVQQDDIAYEEITVHSSAEFLYEGTDGFIGLDLSSCGTGYEGLCKGNIVIDARHVDPGQYRNDIYFYEESDDSGNIGSGVRLPVVVDVGRSDYTLIKRLREDDGIAAIFGGLILLACLIAALAYFR